MKSVKSKIRNNQRYNARNAGVFEADPLTLNFSNKEIIEIVSSFRQDRFDSLIHQTNDIVYDNLRTK